MLALPFLYVFSWIGVRITILFCVEMLDRHEGIYKIRQEFINHFPPDYLQGYGDQNKCLLSMLFVCFFHSTVMVLRNTEQL